MKPFDPKPDLEEACRYHMLATLLENCSSESLQIRLQLLASLSEERATILAELEKEYGENDPAYTVIKQLEAAGGQKVSSRSN